VSAPVDHTMISLPGGEFAMGAPGDEEGSATEERPQHRVQVAPFQIGKFLVTFADWDAAIAAGASASES
jgi:formylglycine-generating enzyme required for sulfatase activity